jgi:CheY-like chemotaxis protein
VRILFLDDDDIRAAAARQWAARCGHELQWVAAVADFAEAFDLAKFDLICLDHDLNDFPEFHSSTEPGMYGNVELNGTHAARHMMEVLLDTIDATTAPDAKQVPVTPPSLSIP